MVHGFWGKRMPLWGRNGPTRSDGRVVDQGLELLPLLLGDGGPQVLDFSASALTDEDDLSDFIDSSHPGITNQLRIQGRYAVRLLGIAGGGGLPLQHTRCAVQFADRVDEGDKALPELNVRVNRIC